jgi:D-alanyl-D-alanine carboxypeptidase (penicillin-binding protein 5/6)
MKICNTLNTFFIFFITVIFLLPNTIFAIYIPNDTLYVWSENTIQTSSENETSSDFLDLSCESAILIEQTTGTVLYEKNAHSKLRPASVTKIMTILLIMEALNDGQISYDTIITCSENAASMGGSQIWLEVRRKLNCR